MSAWILGGSMVVGGIMSGIGANKSAKAIDKTNAQNKAAAEEADRQNWVQYLMQRGIMPTGRVEVGEIPTSYKSVNTRMPLWATMNRPIAGRPGAPVPGAPAGTVIPGASAPPRGQVPQLRRS